MTHMTISVVSKFMIVFVNTRFAYVEYLNKVFRVKSVSNFLKFDTKTEVLSLKQSLINK